MPPFRRRIDRKQNRYRVFIKLYRMQARGAMQPRGLMRPDWSRPSRDLFGKTRALIGEDLATFLFHDYSHDIASVPHPVTPSRPDYCPPTLMTSAEAWSLFALAVCLLRSLGRYPGPIVFPVLLGSRPLWLWEKRCQPQAASSPLTCSALHRRSVPRTNLALKI